MRTSRTLPLLTILVFFLSFSLVAGQAGDLSNLRLKVLLSRELDSAGSSRGFDFAEVELEAVVASKIVAPFDRDVPRGQKLRFKVEGGTLNLDGEAVPASEVTLLGTFRLLSAKRAYGVPVYRDTLIVKQSGSSIFVLNEVDLETYTELVVPSEVPSWFEKEAIKAQAVVARSRAVADYLKGEKARLQGAHCDDSTNYQVFNNQAVSDVVRTAVLETRGLILVDESGAPLSDIFYFSTSGGFTSNNEEVWRSGDRFPGDPIPFFRAKPQFSNFAVVCERTEGFWSLFYRSFWGIEKDLMNFYDKESPWFRWKVTLTREELENIVSRGLRERERADRSLGVDMVKVVDGAEINPDDASFHVGKISDVQIIRRGESGIVMTLRIVAERGTYDINQEYNIRFVVRPRKDYAYPAGGGRDIVLELWNGSTQVNYSILPSGYFSLEIRRNAAGELERVTFWGGGNGHGVGMSQYGANYLAKTGNDFTKILAAYYTATIRDVRNAK